MKAVGRPILATLRGRGFAAQAAAKQVEERAALAPEEVKVSKQPNGIVVASLENHSPISRVTAVFGAGSRYESLANAGITHCLRVASNAGTAKSTAFAIAKNIQQIGGSVTCTTTREVISYNLECTRDGIDTGVEYLSHLVQPSFKPWEVSAGAARLKFDLAQLAENPSAQLMEALHKAAYRENLGNSLYIQPHRIGSYSGDDLAAFVASHYTADNLTLVGLGVDHESMVAFSKKFSLSHGSAPDAAPAGYCGGEVRVETASPFVYAAVVTEGCGWTTPDVASLCVLQQIMGTGPSVKYGTNTATSRINKAVAAVTANPAAASCIMATYTDSGLFGFQVIAHAADAEKGLRAATGVFADATKGSITEADVTRAKAQLRTAYLMGLESGQDNLMSIAHQVTGAGHVVSVDQGLALMDTVTLADVTKIAKKVINGKPSMAAVGDLTNTPYMDKLL